MNEFVVSTEAAIDQLIEADFGQKYFESITALQYQE